MNLLIKYAIIFALAVALLSFFTSCNKLVDAGVPEGKVLDGAIFAGDSTANSAVAGIYALIMNTGLSFSNGAVTIYTGLTSDELNYTGTTAGINEFQTNSISVTNGNVSTIWTNAYAVIYQANICLEGLNSATSITPALKNQLIGECKVARALEYFYLVNLFGDVPFVINTDYNTNAFLPRTPKSQIISQLIVDLQDAQNLLGANYYFASTGRIRPNKWTAAALLARIYLFDKNWQSAMQVSSYIINSGQYSLLTDLTQVFLSNSNESIWQLRPTTSTKATVEGNNIIPSTTTTKPDYAVTDQLYNTFESGDKRKSKWIVSVTLNSITYNYPFKYQVRSAASITEQYTVFRLSEQFLIRAEARANLGDTTGATTDLNTVRTRAGLPVLNPTSQAPLLSAIYHERQVELFAEWGHRWLDLIRTGRADAILAPIKGASWQSTDQLFPIPNKERLANYTLTQNLGYN